MRETLKKHPDLLNVTNADGETLLHAAVRSDDFTAAQLLMQDGADPLQRDAHGETALYLAQKVHGGGIANTVKIKGANQNFYWAIATRNQKEFDEWLKAEPKLVNMVFDDGQTVLMVATGPGVPKFFSERLLELGTSLDPISALRLNRMEEARKLIQDATNVPSSLWFEAMRLSHYGELEDLASARGGVQALDGEGHTLLYAAIGGHHTNEAGWLREQGVATTFFDAVALGDTNQIAATLATNRELANAPHVEGYSVLMLAAKAKQRESARMLIANGADVAAKGPQGWTALHVACNFGAAGVVEELLRAGADPNQMEANGMGPLHLCAAQGQTEIALLLVKHGAKVDLRQIGEAPHYRCIPAGSTPLHYAANFAQAGMVELLLQHGANVKATNAIGETALDLVSKMPSVSRYQMIVLPPGSVRRVPPRDPQKAWAGVESALTQAGGVRRREAMP